MKLRIESLFAFVVFLAATSAGSLSAKEILLVVHGGYTSCVEPTQEQPLPPYALHFIKHVTQLENDLTAASHRVHSIVACFGDATPPGDPASFVSSRTPGTLQSGNAAAIGAEIAAFASSVPDLAVYLVGHSYGGFTVMHMTQALDPAIAIAGLFTIDPISTRCGSLGGRDCHRAPVDFDNDAIRARVQEWHQFYQTQDRWLKSSEISQAENHEMSYAVPTAPHLQVADDARVWAQITDVID